TEADVSAALDDAHARERERAAVVHDEHVLAGERRETALERVAAVVRHHDHRRSEHGRSLPARGEETVTCAGRVGGASVAQPQAGTIPVCPAEPRSFGTVVTETCRARRENVA